MRLRRGFTLLELLLAMVLAGIVALLVYGVVGAAADTQRRVDEQRRDIRAANAMRAIIHDALRNVRSDPRVGRPAFVLEDRSDVTGRPMDRLSFVSAGAIPPLTPDADWSVTVEPSSAGIVLRAEPLGVALRERVIYGFAHITGLDVRVQEFGRGREERGWEWHSSLSSAGIVPRAVALTYWSDAGPIGPPVIVALPLGDVQ